MAGFNQNRIQILFKINKYIHILNTLSLHKYNTCMPWIEPNDITDKLVLTLLKVNQLQKSYEFTSN